MPVVRGPIRVQRAEEPPSSDDLQKRPEGAHRPFLFHEEARVNLAGRIVQGDDQVPETTRNPLMTRTVLVQHHPRQGPTRPLAPMRATAGRRLDRPRLLKHLLGPGIATINLVTRKFLVKMLDREVTVVCLEQGNHLHHFVQRRTTGGFLAKRRSRSPSMPSVSYRRRIRKMCSPRTPATPPPPRSSSGCSETDCKPLQIAYA